MSSIIDLIAMDPTSSALFYDGITALGTNNSPKYAIFLGANIYGKRMYAKVADAELGLNRLVVALTKQAVPQGPGRAAILRQLADPHRRRGAIRELKRRELVYIGPVTRPR